MKFLIDASVAAKWLFKEPDSENALSLLDQRHTLVAPDLLVVEVANVVWKKRMRSEISSIANQLEILDRFQNMLVLLNTVDFVGEATNLAVELEHPVYDCVYLACAVANNIPLVTADRRLLQRASVKLRELEVIELASIPER